MLTTNFSPVDILIALYPELHYRFRYFKFSRYFRNEPEILVDLPRRTENGTIPVMLFVKDSEKYPLEIKGDLVAEFIGENEKITRQFEVPSRNLIKPFWWTVFEVNNIPSGNYKVNFKLQYERRGKTKTIINHNFPGLLPTPFLLTSTHEPLPKPEGYLLGDLHIHSNYTSDHVEFGAPLLPTSLSAKTMGLDFVGVTDHTYDMDDDPVDYLKNDPRQRKWKSFLEDVSAINSDDSGKYAKIISGQEITVRNFKKQNIHSLLFGGDTLFQGSGDDAEKWRNTRSEHSIRDILIKKSADTILGAAHPWENVPFLEKLLLKRGNWTDRDIPEKLDGIQIANGSDFSVVKTGLVKWEKLLKAGNRLALWGGTDAHGNFNLYRQVKIPMWSLEEKDVHVMGMHRTGVYSPSGLDGIMDGLRDGATFITDGPAIDLVINKSRPGSVLNGGKSKISIECISSEEYGLIENLSLIHIENNDRNVLSTENINSYNSKFSFELNLKSGFVYCICKTIHNRFCITSAIYIK